MKLTFEPSAGEAEVVVRGDPGDPEVPRILAALQTAAVRQGRLLLRKAGTEREYLLELSRALRPQGFVQISKGIVVNVQAVRAVEAEVSGNYTALLRDGKTRLTISRSYMRDFRNYVLEGK